MEDIGDACIIVNKTAGEIGMTEDDRRKSNDLLAAYGNEHDRLLQEMLSLLGSPDTSNLRAATPIFIGERPCIKSVVNISKHPNGGYHVAVDVEAMDSLDALFQYIPSIGYVPVI